jgi:uncharacterized membrane protein YgaE (UPF0421/DUF939 family)
MKSLGDNARFSSPTKPFIDTRMLVIFVGIAIGICVAIYAMTVDPNNAAAPIGFPP